MDAAECHCQNYHLLYLSPSCGLWVVLVLQLCHLENLDPLSSVDVFHLKRLKVGYWRNYTTFCNVLLLNAITKMLFHTLNLEKN